MVDVSQRSELSLLDHDALARAVGSILDRHEEIQDWTILYTQRELGMRYPGIDFSTASTLAKIATDPGLSKEFDQSLTADAIERMRAVPLPDFPCRIPASTRTPATVPWVPESECDGKETNMENPTLERMEAWRDQATERLSLFARSNAIEEPIGIGEECYQLGEDCYKPDGYDQFRWVTEDQFDSVLPPGIEHDRYIAMTNMTGFDDEIKEWSANWNDPGYWHDAAADALWSSNDGAYWTTRDEDPSDAVMARATAASQIALELDADNLIERTPENIGLLHDIVDTVHGMDPESDLGYYRAYPSETARETVGEHLTDGEIAEKTMYGGWNPDRDRYLRVNKDGDWVGMDQTTADRLVWDNRTPILKSVGAYADDMPADLTDRVCVMDERSSAARVKAPDPWTGVDPDALFQANGPTIPDPDPGVDPAAGNGPMDPGIGM